MQSTELIQAIVSGVQKAQVEEVEYAPVFENEESVTGKNEFLFFVKPEITLESPQIKLAEILEMVFGKIKEFGLQIQNISVLSASYLKTHDIIAQHYGVINQIASNAKQNMSDNAKAKFSALFGKSVDEVDVLGGIEFLEKYDMFNATSADFLWQNKKNQKLAGGTYCEDIKMDGEVVYVVNGFHPRQLLHFTEKGRSIVVFTLAGDVDWADARGKFIGATDPESAAEGSVRGTLLKNKDTFGLAEVSQGSNGAHLSAGPIEGLIELIRYNSNFGNADGAKTYKDFSFGKTLAENFSESQIELILANIDVEVDGESISIFDLTEEKNSDESIELLKKALS